MFPSIRSTSTGATTTNGTSHPITLPSSISAGDLILLFAGHDGSGGTVTAPTDFSVVQANTNNATLMGHAIFGKVATGSEGSTSVSWGTSNGEQTTTVCFVVQDWSGTLGSIVVGTPASGASANPDPSSVSTGSAADYLFIASFTHDNGNRTISGNPANYTGSITSNSTGTGGCGTAAAYRQLNATSDDPNNGWVVSTSDDWVANTIIVPPAAPSGFVVQDSAHAHTADNIVLTQHNVLVVQDATHSHVADNIAFGGAPGEPSVVGTAFTATNGATWTFNGPSTVAVGDLLLLFLIADDTQLLYTGTTTGSPTWPSGFTEIESGQARTAGGDVSGYAAWKIAAAGDIASGTPNSYQATFIDAAAQGSAFFVRINGHDPDTPIVDTSFAVSAAGATSITLPSVTTIDNNSLLVGHFAVDESSNLYDPYWAEPPITGWTSLLGTSGTSSGRGSSDTYAGSAYFLQTNAGASGDKVANVRIENDAIVGFLVAVAPGSTVPELTVQDSTHSHTADNLSLTQHNILAVQDGTHGHISDAIALTQHNILVVHESTHSHTVDAITLTTHNTLTVADGTHGHTSDNIVLIQHNILAVQDGSHSHVVDNVPLTQHNVLTVQDATHGHVADNVDLGVAGGYQTWTNDQPWNSSMTWNGFLSGIPSLAVQDSTHALTSDNIVLTQHNALIVQDSVHAHTTDSIALTQHHVLVIQDGIHSHTVDNVVLSAVPMLQVQDGIHSHSADELVLTQHNVLIVQDGLHSHTADTLLLVYGDLAARIWNNASWQMTISVWNGTSWRTDAKVWNGTSWVNM